MLILSPADSPSVGFFIIPQKFMVFFDHVHVSFVFRTACISKNNIIPLDMQTLNFRKKIHISCFQLRDQYNNLIVIIFSYINKFKALYIYYIYITYLFWRNFLILHNTGCSHWRTSYVVCTSQTKEIERQQTKNTIKTPTYPSFTYMY